MRWPWGYRATENPPPGARPPRASGVPRCDAGTTALFELFDQYNVATLENLELRAEVERLRAEVERLKRLLSPPVEE